MPNPDWNRKELILALDLYFSLSYGQMDGKNADVIALSRLLSEMNKPEGFSRTVNSVSLKLANFKRLDPDCKSSGMKGGGKQEEVIWKEYSGDREKLRNEAAAIKKEIQDRQKQQPIENQEIKYEEIEEREATPPPGPMMLSLRDLGYSTSTAVADIIDNAIFAKAKTIRIDFIWDGKRSRIIFTDNGAGMTNDELADAMRPGNQSPDSQRDTNDLGRFGLGLKTASLSQCKMFTVLSRKKSEPLCYWRWDLDYVTEKKEWIIRRTAEPQDRLLAEKMESGTMVVWDHLDRIVEMDKKEYTEDDFYEVAKKVKRHVEMVFHRYLESGKLEIIFNGIPAKAWDPFLRGETATQPLLDELLKNGTIRVRPYILPHRSKLEDDIWLENDKRGGWDAMQGFYIYRNERLLLGADWLGLTRKKSHYKLARIMIDLPNYFDHEWQIDIKKSRAKPPVSLRQQLKAIMMTTVTQAEQVFRHRGKQVQRTMKEEFSFVWSEEVKNDRYFFRINRAHPVIASLLEKLSANKKDIEKMLRTIEETVPAPAIIAREQEFPDNIIRPFEKAPDAELISMIKELSTGWKRMGWGDDFIRRKLLMTEPFNDYPQLIENLKL